MSSPFRSKVARLWSSKELSDCSIRFIVDASSDGEPQKRQKTQENVGEALPAHSFVLQLSSARFKYALENTRANNDGQPELSVPLQQADELPAACDALRYLYTNTLASRGFRDMLLVRRYAQQMQLSGCVGAVDAMMSSWLSTRQHDSLELYACDHLFPADDPEAGEAGEAGGAAGAGTQQGKEGVGFRAVLAAAKQQVVRHFGDALAVLGRPELQAQALALPARGLEALLEADDFATDDEASVLLLLARWVEARRAAHSPVPEAVLTRLCRLVRLTRLNSAYLTFVLPRIGWFAILPHELAFVLRYAAAAATHAAASTAAAAAGPAAPPPALVAGGGGGGALCEGLAATMKDEYKMGSPWYGSPRRQALPSGGRSVRWHVERSELQAALASGAKTYLQGRFETGLGEDGGAGEDGAEGGDPHKGGAGAGAGAGAGGTTVLTARGLEWGVRLRTVRGGPAAAGAYVKCSIPAPFAYVTAGLAVPSARLIVFKWRAGRPREVAYTLELGSEAEAVPFGRYQGDAHALPLQQLHTQTQPSQAAAAAAGAEAGGEGAAAQLSAWGEYLHEGRVHGELVFLPN
ncbi:hypothetical protein TSOC_003014 [Tetrabaena socialis]|uniref:BACK domain-containing protein n=1 Tax=Tetrabaena socialis TaxID=47790 RepID=A0A2J8ACM8_9CHLO|nr:hypothetical protein TSOC_003014 [Tetrabaena socialis]|eukprot:PNH10269.1 hypothetical protein TSOC_003014 [Tetrabaena socialis]